MPPVAPSIPSTTEHSVNNRRSLGEPLALGLEPNSAKGRYYRRQDSRNQDQPWRSRLCKRQPFFRNCVYHFAKQQNNIERDYKYDRVADQFCGGLRQVIYRLYVAAVCGCHRIRDSVSEDPLSVWSFVDGFLVVRVVLMDRPHKLGCRTPGLSIRHD